MKKLKMPEGLSDETGREPVSPEAAARMRTDCWGLLYDPMAEREYVEAFVGKNRRWLKSNSQRFPACMREGALSFLAEIRSHADVKIYRFFARKYLLPFYERAERNGTPLR